MRMTIHRTNGKMKKTIDAKFVFAGPNPPHTDEEDFEDEDFEDEDWGEED